MNIFFVQFFCIFLPQWKQCQTSFLGDPKSLQMVIATMKLKDTYSLEGKLIFSSPVATAEFSKFAGILSAALSQHHLSLK